MPLSNPLLDTFHRVIDQYQLQHDDYEARHIIQLIKQTSFDAEKLNGVTSQITLRPQISSSGSSATIDADLQMMGKLACGNTPIGQVTPPRACNELKTLITPIFDAAKLNVLIKPMVEARGGCSANATTQDHWIAIKFARQAWQKTPITDVKIGEETTRILTELAAHASRFEQTMQNAYNARPKTSRGDPPAQLFDDEEDRGYY